MKKDSFVFGRSRLTVGMLPCAEGLKWLLSLWSFPLSLCVFLLCFGSYCGSALWLLLHLLWFMVVVVSSVLVTFHYGTSTLKTWGLKAATTCYFSQLCWLTKAVLLISPWVYLHGFSQLGTHLQWLRQLGHCGLSFHVVSSWLSSWHGDLRVPEGRKLQDLLAEAGKSHSNISAAFHYSKQVRRPPVSRGGSHIVTGI